MDLDHYSFGCLEEREATFRNDQHKLAYYIKFTFHTTLPRVMLIYIQCTLIRIIHIALLHIPVAIK